MALNNAQLDSIIDRIQNVPYLLLATWINELEIRQLCKTTTHVLMGQPTLVEIQPPVVACGDIHGQFSDLKRILASEGHPSDTKYLFLGDFVDRAWRPQSYFWPTRPSTPDNFTLLRGNHEISSINHK
uniref:protein-serine/threonine phosphatase n=1 Tax=Globodera pallida TaxID=36090 RepID=A0A183BJK4_GLOPA